MIHIGESILATGMGERCNGCDCPALPRTVFRSLRTADGDLFGWFCPDCVARWLATHEALLWGCCARCRQKRSLFAIDSGDPEGADWLCEDCRKGHQER